MGGGGQKTPVDKLVFAAGGGALRDVLLAQIPAVLHVDFYATAALIGSIIVVVGRGLGLPPTATALVGGFVLRLVAVWQHWRLPTAIGA